MASGFRRLSHLFGRPADPAAASEEAGAGPRSARAAILAEAVERSGVLEIVAIDDGDRNVFYNRLAEQLDHHRQGTLIRLDASDAVTAELTETLLRVVRQLGAQLRPAARRALDQALTDLETGSNFIRLQVKNTINADRDSTADIAGAQNTTINVAEPKIRGERLAEIAADATSRHGGHITVLIDHAEWYTTGPGRSWLEHYRRRADPHAIIHMLVQPEPSRTSSGDRRVLPPLTDADIQELTHLTDPELVAAVRQAAADRPWLIHVIGSHVAQTPGTDPAAQLEAISQGPSGTQVWDALSTFTFVADTAYLGPAIERMSLLRALDEAVVEAVVRPALPPEHTVHRLFADLRTAHLIDDDAFPDGTAPGFRLLAPVVDAARERLEPQPEARKAIHQLAAEHYWGRVAPEESADARELQYWYRFESSRWLADLREWIHHSRHGTAFADADDRRVTRLRLTRWYLEGFYWFEYMARHRFCEELLREWAEWASVLPEEAAWVGYLQTFHATFGRGVSPELTGPPPDWKAARRAISQIRTGIPIARRSPPPAPTDASRSYALATYLEGLVIALAGDTASYKRGEALFRDAQTWFVDDEWAQAWTALDRIYLQLESDDADLAAASTEVAWMVEVAREADDVCFQAQTLALQATFWLRDDEYGAAAQAIIAGLTIMLAYQTKQESILVETNNFPNEYTRQVYLLMEQDALGLLAALADAGQGEVRGRFDTVVAQIFAAFSDLADPQRGWAPPPDPEDLDKTDTDWLSRAREVVEQAENMDILSKTATTPLPWFDAFAGTPSP